MAVEFAAPPYISSPAPAPLAAEQGGDDLRPLPLPDSQQGRKGIESCPFPSTGLQISLYFYSVISTICNKGKKKVEGLKSRTGHLGMQKIPRKRERERGDNCETAALKEEMWTHKQKHLDQHQEIC